MNEQLDVFHIVAEPYMLSQGVKYEQCIEQVEHALAQVYLPVTKDFLKRRAHTLSGGQRQRIAVARALIMKPKLLIADEISSMLDASNAANLMRLLKGIQSTIGFSMLFITHDLPLAQKISDRIYIMQAGQIIESGASYQVFQHPVHDYTKKLIGVVSR